MGVLKRITVFVWQLFKRPFLLMRGNKVPLSTRVDSNCTLTYCSVGHYSYIRSGAQFNHAIIGNYCSIAADVQIGGMEHPINEYSTSSKLFSDECVANNDTVIGNDVWIAAGAIIRQGIHIGNGAVIGANSFVNKDVPPFAIVAGSPARIIKYRFDNDTQELIIKSGYWDMPPKKAKSVLLSLKQQCN
jgi:acetyltransferase-like isoleucine patch superfamily enzyme